MTSWTLPQIAEAINATRRNSRALLEEAIILFDAGRYARAAALAILAIEEIGKVNLLRCIVMSRDPEERAAFAAELRNHRAKNAHWIIGALRKKVSFPNLLGAALQGKKARHSWYLDNTKQAAFYTDLCSDGSCRSPLDSIDKNFAKQLIACAEELAIEKTVTARELESLREHFLGVENSASLTEALENYLHVLREEGYLSAEPDALIAELGLSRATDNEGS